MVLNGKEYRKLCNKVSRYFSYDSVNTSGKSTMWFDHENDRHVYVSHTYVSIADKRNGAKHSTLFYNFADVNNALRIIKFAG